MQEIEPIRPQFNLDGNQNQPVAADPEPPPQAGPFQRLSNLFNFGPNSPQRRAQQQLAQEALQRQLEEQRQQAAQRIQTIQTTLVNIQRQPTTEASNDPNIRGWASVIGKVANENPEYALALLNMALQEQTGWNNTALNIRHKIQSDLRKQASIFEEIKEKPVETTTVRFPTRHEPANPEDPWHKQTFHNVAQKLGNVAKKTAEVGANFVISSTLSALVKDSASGFATIRADDKGLHITRPFSEQTDVHLEHEKLGAVVVAPNPPAWWDKSIGKLFRGKVHVGAFYGKVVVVDTRGAFKAEAATFNPFKVAEQLKATLKATAPINIFAVPDLKPEGLPQDYLTQTTFNQPPAENTE